MLETDIVNYAREWIGTPFHLQAQVKGVGVDCCNLVEYSLRNAGVIKPVKFGAYNVRDTSQIGNIMLRQLKESINDEFDLIQVKDISAGDIIMFSYSNKQLMHISIATSDNTHIQASEIYGVSENLIEDAYFKRISQIYRVIRNG